jgi:hypothetical protein
MVSFLYRLRRFCRDYYKRCRYPDETFLEACKNNDIGLINRLFDSKLTYPLNKGMLIACENGFPDIVNLLIDEGATNLEETMVHACKHSRHAIIELLIKKGVNPRIALRHTQSLTIIRMINRYINGIENIN